MAVSGVLRCWLQCEGSFKVVCNVMTGVWYDWRLVVGVACCMHCGAAA